MGEGMYVPIAKGSVHKKVDAIVNHKTGGCSINAPHSLLLLSRLVTLTPTSLFLRIPR